MLLYTIRGSNRKYFKTYSCFLDHAEHSGYHGGDLCCTSVDHGPHPRAGRRLSRPQEVLHALSQGYQGICIGMKITNKGDVVIKDLTIKTAECYGLGVLCAGSVHLQRHCTENWKQISFT